MEQDYIDYEYFDESDLDGELPLDEWDDYDNPELNTEVL